MRLLGFLLQYDTEPEKASIWTLLQTQHPTILTFVIENTAGEEALTRYSCWFALERAVRYDGAAQWYVYDDQDDMLQDSSRISCNGLMLNCHRFVFRLLASGKVASMVSGALKDDSSYVRLAIVSQQSIIQDTRHFG